MHITHVKDLAQYLDIKIIEYLLFEALRLPVPPMLKCPSPGTQHRQGWKRNGKVFLQGYSEQAEEKMNTSHIGQPPQGVFISSSAYVRCISQIQRYYTNPNSQERQETEASEVLLASFVQTKLDHCMNFLISSYRICIKKKKQGGQRLKWNIWLTICFSIFVSNKQTWKFSKELCAYFRKRGI